MALGWMISIVQRGRVAMERLEEIFLVESSLRVERPVAERVTPTVRRGAIDFRECELCLPG